MREKKEKNTRSEKGRGTERRHGSNKREREQAVWETPRGAEGQGQEESSSKTQAERTRAPRQPNISRESSDQKSVHSPSTIRPPICASNNPSTPPVHIYHNHPQETIPKTRLQMQILQLLLKRRKAHRLPTPLIRLLLHPHTHTDTRR